VVSFTLYLQGKTDTTGSL